MTIGRFLAVAALLVCGHAGAIEPGEKPEPGEKQPDKPAVTKQQPDKPAETEKQPAPAVREDPAGATRIAPDADVWIDKTKKQVILDSKVCLREGELEMFACINNTKEHESILTVKSKAFYIHAALLAVGAVPGTTVKFEPKYAPATGQYINIDVEYPDKDGKLKRHKAQDWVYNMHTKKAMDIPWVFAGSSFWVDDAGARHYSADSGDLICVSNFPSAMLDLPIESSQANNDLTFKAYTERIPAKGTRVRMYLMPVPEKKFIEKPNDKPQGK